MPLIYVNNRIIKSLSRERALKAYEFVESSINFLTPAQQKEYKSYIKKALSMIKTCGLSATLTFIYSKMNSKKAYEEIYKQLAKYVKHQGLIQLYDINELLKQVLKLPAEQYRFVTRELIELLVWMKRFSDGMIKEDKK